MTRRDAEPWVKAAPPALLRLLRRMKHHIRINWQAADYDDDADDNRIETPDLEDAEAVGSLVGESPVFDMATFRQTGTIPLHCLAIDIDVPVWLVPSSTSGHAHLYADLTIEEDDLWEFLDAAVKIRLVEEGYVSACKSRGMTSLRAPWVRKGQERPEGEQS